MVNYSALRGRRSPTMRPILSSLRVFPPSSLSSLRPRRSADPAAPFRLRLKAGFVSVRGVR